jgi:hypothetical protein
MADSEQKTAESTTILGIARATRFKVYAWSTLLLIIAAGTWSWFYLRPDRWYTFTDEVAFRQAAADVELGYVVWESSTPMGRNVEGQGIGTDDAISEPAISSDNVHMVFVAQNTKSDNDDKSHTDFFVRRFDGVSWGVARPMRALNSEFNESGPCFSGDGRYLYFATDRPGGGGGYDIWIATWDGAEYAWPLPLTSRVNSRFDEKAPSIAPGDRKLYFASNRPFAELDLSEKQGVARQGRPAIETMTRTEIEALAKDYDIYSADRASANTAYAVIVERQLSMLYSLREGALADAAVMQKLGGSAASENAVTLALQFLASTQEEDGRWDIAAHGGGAGHDVAATAFALLAFYGRGQRHDKPCEHQGIVAKGLAWLLSQRDPGTGDMRGKRKGSQGMYDHGIAALALVEAYGVTKDIDLKSPAISAIEFIDEAQHEEGGWRYKPGQKGDLSVSGWMIMALASAQMSGIQNNPGAKGRRIPRDTLADASRFLKIVNGGKYGGSWGYTGPGGTPAMNAVGFFCSQLLGLSANTPRAFEASIKLRGTGFKYEDIYYAYYGTLASYQNQGPAWQEWLAAMQAQFIAKQDEAGWWHLPKGHGSKMGKIVATALVALCLEAHYRYTPLYGLGFVPALDGPMVEVAAFDSLPSPPLFRYAQNLTELNSPADEMDPVVTDHGDYLYFASNRAGGFGGSDIYRSRVGGTIGVSAEAEPEEVEVEDKASRATGAVPAAKKAVERVADDVAAKPLPVERPPRRPLNLGPEINTAGNETGPALRHAGFQLIYNSDRDPQAGGLYAAMSKRVEQRFDSSKLPDAEWFRSNWGWITALVVSFLSMVWSLWRALFRPRSPRTLITEGVPN